jgi:hypothetical protein
MAYGPVRRLSSGCPEADRRILPVVATQASCDSATVVEAGVYGVCWAAPAGFQQTWFGSFLAA